MVCWRPCCCDGVVIVGCSFVVREERVFCVVVEILLLLWLAAHSLFERSVYFCVVVDMGGCSFVVREERVCCCC